MPTKKKKKTHPKTGNCFNCGVFCKDTFYCYGCNHFVCLDCEPPLELYQIFCFGKKHKPDDHLFRIIQLPRGLNIVAFKDTLDAIKTGTK